MIFSVIKTGIKTSLRFLGKHSPEILMIFGTGGVIASTVWAIRATPKALDMKREAEEEKGEELTAVETVKACWKPYIPTVLMGVAGIACFFGAHGISIHRTALLASAYTTAQECLNEYRTKVIDTIGKEKEADIRKELGRGHIQQHKDEFLARENPSGELFLCRDELTGQIFKSNKFIMEKNELVVQKDLLTQCYYTKNEWLDLNGMRPVADGDDYAWSVDDGFEIRLVPDQLDDGRLVYSVEYLYYPIFRDKWWGS